MQSSSLWLAAHGEWEIIYGMSGLCWDTIHGGKIVRNNVDGNANLLLPHDYRLSTKY
jgi:hypothetical protein